MTKLLDLSQRIAFLYFRAYLDAPTQRNAPRRDLYPYFAQFLRGDNLLFCAALLITKSFDIIVKEGRLSAA